MWFDTVNDHDQYVRGQAERRRLVQPAGPQQHRVDLIVLGLAGIQRGDLRGAGRGDTPTVHLLFDLGPPNGEGVEHRLGDPDEIRDAVADRSPLDPEAPGQLDAQLRLVEIPGCLRVHIEPSSVERAVAVIGCPGEVRDQDMGVQVRVSCSARPVSERRAREP